MNLALARIPRMAVLATLLLTLAVIAGCTSGVDPADALGVDAVAADPGAFTGRIAILGVVQNVNEAQSLVTIIDEAEYAACGLSPCGSAGIIPLHLPTSGESGPGGTLYEGSLPALEDLVVVVGEIKSSADGIYFDVERVERGGAPLIEKR